MNVARIVTCVLAGMLLLLSGAQAGQAWAKEQIASSSSKYRGRPKVYGDKVYWTDRRSGDHDIYVYDRTGGERVVLSTPAYEILEAVYEDRIAFTEYTNGQYDLYLYDPVNGKQTISTAPGNQYMADLYGDLLVWQDHRGPVPQVYKWDPMGGEQIISPSSQKQYAPRVFGDTIVWDQNDGAGHNDSYMWNPRDGTVKLSTYIYPMGFPDIYGDTVVMSLYYEPGILDPYGIWQYKLGKGITGPLVPYVTAYDTRVWGDTVTWVTASGAYGSIEVWTLDMGVTRLQTDGGLWPDVYNKMVAWQRADNSIWIAQLVPEPSGLLAFGSLLALAGLVWRRKPRS